MSEPAEELAPNHFGEFDDLDEEVAWRPRPSLLPLILAGAGALVIGLSIGVGAAFVANSPWLATPVQPPEAERVQADLETVRVNLRGEEGDRVLTVRAQVAIETFDPDRVTVLEPALRDTVLVLASDHTADELLSPSTRRRFREELLHRLDLLLGEDRVVDLYLTELVIQ